MRSLLAPVADKTHRGGEAYTRRTCPLRSLPENCVTPSWRPHLPRGLLSSLSLSSMGHRTRIE
jgi:hypothetical protein